MKERTRVEKNEEIKKFKTRSWKEIPENALIVMRERRDGMERVVEGW